MTRRRVLLRLPSWLGDFIMAEPLVRALQAELEEGKIDRLALAGPVRFFELFEGRFEGAERIDSALPERGGEGALYRGFDVAIFLDGSSRGPMTALSCGVPERFGWASGVRRLLFSRSFQPSRWKRGKRLPRPFGAACVELLGLAGFTVRNRRPFLAATEGARARLSDRLGALGQDGLPLHVLRAGGRVGSAKALPLDLLVELRDRLLAERRPLVVTCGPGEGARLEELLRELPPEARLHDPALGLGELVALAERASYHIGADSGPRHVFEAVGCPGAVLFGPTDPRHTFGLAAADSSAVLGPPLPCAPCHGETCALPGASLDCFRGIDSGLVPLEV